MGMRAEVLAIGLFKSSIADCLEYPADFYDGVKDGKLVFGHLFMCEATWPSQALAEALGVEPWDFNTHLITASKVTDAARNELKQFGDEKDLETFDRLAAADFRFIYCPNG